MADSVAEQIAALRDEDWGVREDAATALGNFRDPRGARPLINALRDSDRAVRTAATVALTAIGEPAMNDLGACLRDPDLSVQEAAASILATIADEHVVEPLISALLNPNWVVRMHAAKALGRLKAPQAVGTLILLLQDKVPAVRDESVAALKAIGDAAVPSLVQSLKAPEWKVRLRATEALGALSSASAVEPLLKILAHDPDTAIRQDAARALGEIGDPRAVEPLLQATGDSRLRAPAIEALGKIGDRRAVPSLLAMIRNLNTADYEHRESPCQDDRYHKELVPIEAAVRALARIGDPKALPVLVSALQTSLIRAEASEALGAFGEPAVRLLVDRLKTETDDNIRTYIKEALARLGWRPNRIRL